MKSGRLYTRHVQIGKGSFASVYRVFDTSLQRYCALKTIPVPSAEKRHAVVEEARNLAAASPSCAPHIYDVYMSGATVTIAMEWLSGIPWSLCIKNTLTPGQKYALATATVNALSLLHDRHIAHADLKPGNMLAVPGRGVVFVDFGFARNRHTSHHTIAGTPGYMAPELWKKDSVVDWKKADLFALGILLRELLEENTPDCVASLVDHDPQKRPADASAFLSVWSKEADPGDRDDLHTWIVQQSAVHTAQLLYTGACALIGKKRFNEAYAILTESIDCWPDNADALRLLQTGFSLPFKQTSRSHHVLKIAAVLSLVFVVATAYRIGRQSSGASSEAVPLFDDLQQQIRPQSLTVAINRRPAAPVDVLKLRNSATTSDLTGFVIVTPGNRTGRLFVDGERVELQDSVGQRFELVAGTHRIEWYDSLIKRRFGETVDLLPFCTKRVSFTRFLNNE